jgi:hypothetical protein
VFFSDFENQFSNEMSLMESFYKSIEAANIELVNSSINIILEHQMNIKTDLSFVDNINMKFEVI